MRRASRPIARGLAALGVLLAVLAVRVVTGSRAELGRGEALEAEGDPDAAILAYRRAARLYAPGNPYVPAALARLAAIGERAEQEGERERALAAYRSIRGGILAARSFYVPHGATLARADERIAALSSDGAGDRREALSVLRAPRGPAIGWTLLLLTGWLAWTLGAFAFARRALDEEDRLVPGQARLWGTVIVLGFGLFVIGMALA